MRHLKLFEAFVNEESSPFEITSTKGMDPKEAAKTINDNYPERLTYRGNEFFDKIYMDILSKFAYEKLGIGEYYDADDEESGFEKVRKEGQESYLGYLADEDVFVEGYDVFDSAGNNVVFIKLNDKLNPENVSNKFQFPNSSSMMYGQYGSYDALHKKFPTLIDIRLD